MGVMMASIPHSFHLELVLEAFLAVCTALLVPINSPNMLIPPSSSGFGTLVKILLSQACFMFVLVISLSLMPGHPILKYMLDLVGN